MVIATLITRKQVPRRVADLSCRNIITKTILNKAKDVRIMRIILYLPILPANTLTGSEITTKIGSEMST